MFKSDLRATEFDLWVGHRRFLNVLKMILVHGMSHGILCHVSQDIKKPQKDGEVQSLTTHFLNRFPVSSCNVPLSPATGWLDLGYDGDGESGEGPEQGRDWECYNGKRCALKRFLCAYIKLYQTYSFDLGLGHCITCY